MPALLICLAALVVVAPGSQSPDDPDRATCKVTLSNGVSPGFEISPEYQLPAMPSDDTWYGEDGLCAVVTPNGVVDAQLDPHRGGGWFTHVWAQDARTDGHHDELTFTVTRAGASPGAERPEVRKPAFAVIGRVQTAGIWFPEGGCWELTADTGQRSLASTVWVEIPALEPVIISLDTSRGFRLHHDRPMLS